jgi:hypothetical protein
MITLNCINLHASSAMPPTKLSLLRAAATKGDWTCALSIAAKFPQLGAHKAAITRAHGAIQNPTDPRYQDFDGADLDLARAGLGQLITKRSQGNWGLDNWANCGTAFLRKGQPGCIGFLAHRQFFDYPSLVTDSFPFELCVLCVSVVKMSLASDL